MTKRIAIVLITILIAIVASAQIRIVIPGEPYKKTKDKDTIPTILPKKQKSKNPIIRLEEIEKNILSPQKQTVKYNRKEVNENYGITNINRDKALLHKKSITYFPNSFLSFVRDNNTINGSNGYDVTIKYHSIKEKPLAEIAIKLTYNKDGEEGRLRNSFVKELNREKKKPLIEIKDRFQTLLFKGVEHKTNGMEMLYTGAKNSKTLICTYECGAWLLNVIIKSSQLTNKELYDIEEFIVQFINPTRLTALRPFNLKSNLLFNKKRIKDNNMISALWAEAMGKIEWANENIDENERAAGFPDTYIEMHIDAIKKYLKIATKKSETKNNADVRTLQKVANANYLPELIMEHYNRMLTVPNNIKIDTKAYRNWCSKEGINPTIHTELYSIVYRNLKY